MFMFMDNLNFIEFVCKCWYIKISIWLHSELKSWITDRVQHVSRLGLQQFSVVKRNNLTNFSTLSLKFSP